MKCKCFIAALCGAVFALLLSCSTEVDVFADGDDMPIVYALLDGDADTNFVKITHTMAYPGNHTNANDASLSNYPGKLDVRLTEYCNGDSIRQIILDTITIHNKEEGLFYAPAQKLYYTTERLEKNTSGKWYSYKLTIFLPDRTVTATADMVGSDDFYIRSTVADFSGGYHYFEGLDRSNHEIWFVPAVNGGVYSVNMSFTYFERRSWTSDTIPHTISWHLGYYYQFFLPQHMHNDAYVVTYHPYDLYFNLDKYLGDDTLVPGLRRYLDDEPIKVTVTAGDRNLEEYIYYYQMSSDPTGENINTHLNGAFGVFSTTKTVERNMRLGGTTVPELMETKWGFKYVGGHL